jgi:serine protease AprX
VNAFLGGVDVARVATGAPEAWFKYGVTGKKVGIAVLDSGIAPVIDLSTEVVQTVDMVTGSTTATDPFGHGTHVAGILGGMGTVSKYKYLGVSPQASIFNVRVLDDNGRGLTSTVIKGIEWVIKNRNGRGKTGVDIRVINLALGHAPTESASTDPLALACRKAVGAGIVVVVSAGNYGKDANGNPVYGGITSPGTEPSVITVGAMNIHGSLNRSDDALASYSSKGPTIDGIIKPDIVAPGSNIIAPMAPKNKLVTQYPQLAQDSYYMKLSGTSMAAPVVAGAVAMILERNPALTPNTVKAILMYTAERTNKNPLEVGAGYLNVLGAVNLAANIDPTRPLSQYWITNGGLGLTHVDTTVSGYSIVWGNTIVWNDALYSGDNVLYNQDVWGTSTVWGAKTNWSTTIVWETDLAAFDGLIQGQTIVWEDVLTIVWDDVLTIVWDLL